MLSAAARSVGIPARLEPNDQRPQFWINGSWTDAIVEKNDGATDLPADSPAPSPAPSSRILPIY